MISKFGFFSAAVLLGACGSQPSTPSPPAPYPAAWSEADAAAMRYAPDAGAPMVSTPAASVSAARAAAAPEFSYSDASGPEHWATLDSTFTACAGSQQSPIELPAKPLAAGATADVVEAPHLEKFPLKILNNGHTVQVNDSAPSSLKIGATTYALAQFHFHMPSEHTVAGSHFDGELHFVFKSADGKIAVLGMFIKEGKSNQALSDVIDHAPLEKSAETTIDKVTIDALAIIPKNPEFYRYDGSLTVPPCTEGLTWLVVSPKSGVVELSIPQLAKLTKALHAPNNRPLQPLNGRSLSDVRGFASAGRTTK